MICRENEQYLLDRYTHAAGFLPPALKEVALAVPDRDKMRAQEFRLRIGQPMSFSMMEGEKVFGGGPIRKEEILALLECATASSLHAYAESIRNGFITLEKGHRLGLCGTAACEGGRIHTIKNFSSVCLRIAKEIKGACDEIWEPFYQNGRVQNTLILSSPGGGKTTLLRDLIRRVSQTHRVSVADERGEIAALYENRPQFDLGPRTDVLEGCPKDAAMLSLLRSMSPQIIAIDEITAPADIDAMTKVSNCAVCILATAHANDCDDLQKRPLYRMLLQQEIFTCFIIIEHDGAARRYRLTHKKEDVKCSRSSGSC